MSKRQSDSVNGKPAKRRRVEVTAGQKRQICEYKRDNPSVSLSDVQKWAGDKLNLTIGKSTVGDIVRTSNKWLQVTADSLQRMSLVKQINVTAFFSLNTR